MLLTILHSEWPKLYGVLVVLSAIGLESFLSQPANTLPSHRHTDVKIYIFYSIKGGS